MPKPKYKEEYSDMLVAYFLKFIEMRDDPKDADEAAARGYMLCEKADGVYKAIPPAPSPGYPTLTKFAIKIGVTPRTLTNWRDKKPAFAEACEFADAIQDDILNERALTGEVDGKVAMKIRELKMNAKKHEDGASGGAKLSISFHDDRKDEKIEIKKWVGEINEDTEY